jgi:hypothetical protein
MSQKNDKLTKNTIRITNETEQDIEIEVTAVERNKYYVGEDTISRKATFIPGMTRDFWIPKIFNYTKVTLFIGNEIVREELLPSRTTWTITESSLNSPSYKPIKKSTFIFDNYLIFIFGVYLGNIMMFFLV